MFLLFLQINHKQESISPLTNNFQSKMLTQALSFLTLSNEKKLGSLELSPEIKLPLMFNNTIYNKLKTRLDYSNR